MLKIKLTSSENVDESSDKAFQSLQELMSNDSGSQLTFHLDADSNLERMNFQSSLMTKVFNEFPKALLMLRIKNTKHKTLYVFVADGPCMRTEYDLVKLVHIAVPKNESSDGLLEMFTVMKDFNPCWPEISTFLVDTQFEGTDVISEIFPSAEVVLSAYHVGKCLQEEIYDISLPETIEKILVDSLKTTMCSATAGNLHKMHKTLHESITPDLLGKLNADLLLQNKIWELHHWRTFAQCCLYFQTMEMLTNEFGYILNKHIELEDGIVTLIKFVQENTAAKWQPGMHTCSIDEKYREKWPQMENNVPTTQFSFLESEGKSNSNTEAGSDLNSHLVPERESEAGALICQSLERICIPAAYDLCVKELCAAQKSMQLSVTRSEDISIQLIENSHEVSWDIPRRCTCYFNQCLKLPCRHILSVLNANKEVVKPEMFDSLWHKQINGFENVLPVPVPTLEIIKGDVKGLPEKNLRVEALINQMTQLLADCSNDVFQHRYDMLRELADSWIGPYEQVKL